MALIKLSSVGITNISGKAGGSIYAHNRGGAYVRNFAVPSNPQTPSQMANRASFGALSALWRTLTPEQQEAWRQSATSFPVKDAFGDQKILSGIALHQQLNRNLGLINQSLISNPPVPAGAASFFEPVVVVDINATTQEMTFTITAAAANPSAPASFVLVYASPSMSPGIQSPGSAMRLIGRQASATITSGADVADDYSAVFGDAQPGAAVFVRLQAVNSTTGERGAPVFGRVIVTETTP